jgi:hypothetical protein
VSDPPRKGGEWRIASKDYDVCSQQPPGCILEVIMVSNFYRIHHFFYEIPLRSPGEEVGEEVVI